MTALPPEISGAPVFSSALDRRTQSPSPKHRTTAACTALNGDVGSDRTRRSRVFRVSYAGTDFFPRYQFDALCPPLPVIKEVQAAFGRGADTWTPAAWFHFPRLARRAMGSCETSGLRRAEVALLCIIGLRFRDRGGCQLTMAPAGSTPAAVVDCAKSSSRRFHRCREFDRTASCNRRRGPHRSRRDGASMQP